MTDYAGIIERLEAADGMDRDLDKEIGFALMGWRYKEVGGLAQMIYVPDEQAYYVDHPDSLYPSITESLDASVALVEKSFPGKVWYVRGHANGDFFCQLFTHEVQRGLDPKGTAPTAPIAILLALFRALEAKGKGG